MKEEKPINRETQFRQFYDKMFDENMKIIRGRKKNTTNGHITNATNAMMSLMKTYKELFPGDFTDETESAESEPGMKIHPKKKVTGFVPKDGSKATA